MGGGQKAEKDRGTSMLKEDAKGSITAGLGRRGSARDRSEIGQEVKGNYAKEKEESRDLTLEE